MKPPMLLKHFMPAFAVWLAAGSVAHARPIDCSAETPSGATKCLIATERVQTSRDLLSPFAARLPVTAPAAAIAPAAFWPSTAAARSGPVGAAQGAGYPPSEPVQNDDLPLPGLLLAALGVVAFMAHRRSAT
jgi:hypothetical protein